jgi:glycerate kinase
MRVLLAFDKFKEALTASDACRVVAKALTAEGMDVVERPLTDGGEGFCPLLTEAVGGELDWQKTEGPLGEWHCAPVGWVECHRLPDSVWGVLPRQATASADGGRLAVIGMAEAAGLEQVSKDFRDPWRTTTVGVGRQLQQAIQANAKAIVIGLGGSATCDLGLGALHGVGFRFLDAEGDAQVPLPCNWSRIVTVVPPPSSFFSALPAIFLACDVDNPLFGPRGAGPVFGPQKGLLKAELSHWEALAAKMADLLEQACGASASTRELAGAGAAGGFAYGLTVGLGAEIVSGFELVANWLDLETAVASVDCVVTGEGRWDSGSLSGKGPYAVAVMADRLHKPVGVFAGSVDAAAAEDVQKALKQVSVHAISPVDLPLEEALRTTHRHLPERVIDWLLQLSQV